MEVRIVEQIQRDIPRTYLVRHLHSGPEHPLCKQAEKVLPRDEFRGRRDFADGTIWSNATFAQACHDTF